MNKATRKLIEEMRDSLQTIHDSIEDLGSEERDKFDNMPDSLKQGDNGQKCEAAADALDSAATALQEAIEHLETASE